MDSEDILFGINIFENRKKHMEATYLISDIYSLQDKVKMPKDLNPYFAGINIPKNLLKNKTKLNLLLYGMENPYFIYIGDEFNE